MYLLYIYTKFLSCSLQQTIGQATANKYPVKGNQSVIAHRKIAGQSGQMPVVTPNIQTVKVVD